MTGKIIALKHSIYLRNVCDMKQNNVCVCFFFLLLLVRQGFGSDGAVAVIDIIVRISLESFVWLGYLHIMCILFLILLLFFSLSERKSMNERERVNRFRSNPLYELTHWYSTFWVSSSSVLLRRIKSINNM